MISKPHDLFNEAFAYDGLPTEHLNHCEQESSAVNLTESSCDCYARQIYFKGLRDGESITIKTIESNSDS